MFRVDVRDALEILSPRYNIGGRNSSWPRTGKYLMFNSQKLPDRVDKSLHRLMNSYDDELNLPPIKWVNVSRDNVWYLQRNLRVKNVQYFIKHLWRWQHWPRAQLPTIISYHGKLVIWNGTHRTILCRLAGKRIRARLIDLDAYIELRHDRD